MIVVNFVDRCMRLDTTLIIIAAVTVVGLLLIVVIICVIVVVARRYATACERSCQSINQNKFI